ncbi:MAG TPA: hypothetical protein VJ454_00390, partial [Steroidobacteraceae bacterium]|nr:hypothetical protein [Steroidobacteraceae bacterium]
MLAGATSEKHDPGVSAIALTRRRIACFGKRDGFRAINDACGYGSPRIRGTTWWRLTSPGTR